MVCGATPLLERKDQIRVMTQHRERLRRFTLELSVIRKRGGGQTRDEQHWRRQERPQEKSPFCTRQSCEAILKIPAVSMAVVPETSLNHTLGKLRANTMGWHSETWPGRFRTGGRNFDAFFGEMEPR